MSFKFLGDERACITNYLNALTWSPYKDMDMSHFISLANHLIRIDRFEEALAMVKKQNHVLDSTQLLVCSSTLVATLDTLESVLATRLGNYGEALENALKIAQPTDVMEANKPSSAIQEKSASRSPNPFQLISEKFDNLLRTDASSDQRIKHIKLNNPC